jgi:hypothetical protein
MAFQGSQPFFNDAVAGAAVNIKANGQALLCGLKLVNTTAAVAYLQFFDVPAASVVLGTTVPKFVMRLSANETTNPSDLTPAIQFYGTGLSIAGTTTANGALGAAISVSAWFE